MTRKITYRPGAAHLGTADDDAPRGADPAAIENAGPDQLVARALVSQRDPVAFVYFGLGVSPAEEERDLRWRQVAARLRASGAPAEVIAVVGSRVAAAPPAPAMLAVFASPDGVVLHEALLAGATFADRAGFDAPAAVTPLLAWAQDRPPYVLVVTDRAGADLTASAGGGGLARTQSVVGPDDEIERNAPGGCSQSRYQHRAEDSWRHNAGRVAAELQQQSAAVRAQVLVLAGDVRAVQLLSERLPSLSDLLIVHLAGGRAIDGSQSERDDHLDRLLREAAARQTARLLAYFHAHLDSAGLSVEGPAETIAALAAGRVAVLLVEDKPDDARTAWFGPSGSHVFADHATAALSDGPISSGRLVDVATWAALMSAARVRVIPTGTPGAPLGGIGALCRYH